ncbi:MAG: glycosyltransferase [Muribaculaceae bacterium]|nr:glycosyltransferase [Muribaculaceae bacterium]
MTLDVLISTMGYDGINRVVEMRLPKVENVRYIVSWQLPGDTYPGQVPAELQDRDDVSVYQLNSRGISINRNNAMLMSTADICLTADDDLRYTSEQLSAVVDAFVSNPDVDIATFRYEGDDNKWYSSREFDLSKPVRGFYVSAIEMAFRREKVVGRVTFNELFGPGEHLLQAGEESVFLHQALCRGLKGRFFPVTITRHRGLSTGSRKLAPGVLMANGAYFAIVYPFSGILRLPLFAWRNYRKGLVKLFPAMRHLLKGYIYGKRNFNHDGTVRHRH